MIIELDNKSVGVHRDTSTSDAINKMFSIGYLLQSNKDFPGFAELIDTVLSVYKVQAVFTYLGYNGDSIQANGQKLVWRDDKFSTFKVGKDVQLIKHNLSTKGGGSHRHPSVSYQGAKVELTFTSYGLPFIDKTNGWEMKLVSLDKLGTLELI